MPVQEMGRVAATVRMCLLLGLAGLFSACGEKKEPTPPPPTPTVAVTVAPTSLSLVAGMTGSGDATIVRGGGYAGPVTLSSTGAPAGMTVTFGNGTIAAGSTTSTVNVATTTAVAAGSYPITINAAGTGAATASATLTVTVSAAPAPAAMLSLSTAAATVQAGGADVTTTATITRANGFADAVTLSHSGAPTGVTVSFAPNPVAASGTTSTITFAVAASTVPGNYPITITGTGNGITAPTAIYTLTVTSAPTPSATIALSSASATVVAGGTSATTTATVTRVNGFTGALTLSQSGAPAGVTVSFSPNPIAAGSTTSTVTIAVAGTATPGTYPIVISAAGTGIASPAATYTLTVVPEPAATLSLSSTAATVQAGGANVTSTATITRVNGFTGALTLSQSGAPTGVTVSFSPNPIAAGGTTSTVTFAVATTTAAGTYPIVISAAGTGITSPTVTYTLTVTAAPTPAATLALSSSSASVQAGGANVTSTATITRVNGFAGALTLSQSGAPSGVTVTFAPNPIAAGSTQSTITFAVASNTVPGTYPIVISAAGTGITSPTATYTLTVTAAPVGTTVTLTYCAEATPIWFAYQDGPSGAWTRVTPSGTTFSFQLFQTRGAIAAVDTFDGGFDMNITYASTAEFTSIGSAINIDACGSKTINGSVSNVATNQFANVTLGYSPAVVQPAASSNFQLIDVRAGAQDLFASRVLTSTRRADKIIIRRGVNVADGGTIPVLDFNAAESFAPVTANFSISNVGSDTATLVSTFNGTRGSAFGFLASIQRYLAATGTVALDLIPLAQLNTGELQQAYAIATAANSTTSSRFAGLYFRTPADATLTLGAALSTPTVTRASNTPYARPRVQLALQADYNRALTAEFEQTSLTRSVSITATSGYTGGTAWDFTMPDLSGAAGWQNTWALQAGTAFDWSLSATSGAIFLFDPNVTSGSTYRSASRSSTSPVP